MSFLFPHENQFFDLLGELHKEADEALSLIESAFRNTKEFCNSSSRIKKNDSASERTYQKTLRELAHTFITPFDREDILGVALAYEVFSQNARILILDACCFEEESSKYGKSFLDHLGEVRKNLSELNEVICAEKISSSDLEATLALAHASVEELKNTIEDMLLEGLSAATNWKEWLGALNNSKNLRKVANSLTSIIKGYETIFVKGL